MRNVREIRIKLKSVQSYKVEKQLLPDMYFIEDENNTEYWIFLYSFVRKLSDEAIGVRLGYTRKSIYLKTLKIIQNNLDLITDLLLNQ